MSELLDLSTVVDRDTVRIRTKKNPNGKVYELLNLDELGAFEHAILSSRHGKVRDLSGRTDRKQTPAEKRTVTKALKDILSQIVIDLEPHVLAELDQVQASKIVAAWALKYYEDDGAAEGEDSASLSTTAGSSPDSKRSTAATRRTGSTSPGGA